MLTMFAALMLVISVPWVEASCAAIRGCQPDDGPTSGKARFPDDFSRIYQEARFTITAQSCRKVQITFTEFQTVTDRGMVTIYDGVRLHYNSPKVVELTGPEKNLKGASGYIKYPKGDRKTPYPWDPIKDGPFITTGNIASFVFTYFMDGQGYDGRFTLEWRAV